jgi:cytochrome c peroxidase
MLPPVLDPDLVARGGLLFLNPGVSGDGARSCTTCHPGGRADASVWKAGVEATPGTPGGRRTRSLRGAWRAAPYYWDASETRLRTVIEQQLSVEMSGAVLPEHDLAALTSYVASLTPFDRGRTQLDGTPTEPVVLTARRGWGVFRKAGCMECHPPPSYLSPTPADIGTGGAIDVPSLRGLGDRAPYGHDGRWASVEDAVKAHLAAAGIELSFDERLYLLEYLKLL